MSTAAIDLGTIGADVAIRLEKVAAAKAGLKRDLGEMGEALRRMAQEAEKAGKRAEDALELAAANRGMREAQKKAKAVADEMKRVQREAEKAEQAQAKAHREFLKGALAAIAVERIGDALFDTARKSVQLAADFERSMNVLQNATKASAADMDRFSETARKLGADTKLPATSSNDAAKAMLELSKAGLTVEDTMNAARGSLQLAAAASVDAGEAAQITANILNQFKLSGDQATRVADLLAAAANSASGEVTDMAAAFAQGGAQFAAMKVSVEDAAAAIALMAKNGVLGSDAGTSLKAMLQQLTKPTDEAADVMEQLQLELFDASGQFVGLREAAKRYESATRNLTDEQKLQVAQTLAGSDGYRGLLFVLSGGEKVFQDQKTAVADLGAAQEAAAAQAKGFAGAVDGLSSAWESFLERRAEPVLGFLGDVADAMAFGIEKADEWLSKLAKLATFSQNSGGAIKQAERPAYEDYAAQAGTMLARRQEMLAMVRDMGDPGVGAWDGRIVRNERLKKLGLPADMSAEELQQQAINYGNEAKRLQKLAEQQGAVWLRGKAGTILDGTVGDLVRGADPFAGGTGGGGGPRRVNFGGGKKGRPKRNTAAEKAARNAARLQDASNELALEADRGTLEDMRERFDALLDSYAETGDPDTLAELEKLNAEIDALERRIALDVQKFATAAAKRDEDAAAAVRAQTEFRRAVGGAGYGAGDIGRRTKARMDRLGKAQFAGAEADGEAGLSASTERINDAVAGMEYRQADMGMPEAFGMTVPTEGQAALNEFEGEASRLKQEEYERQLQLWQETLDKQYEAARANYERMGDLVHSTLGGAFEELFEGSVGGFFDSLVGSFKRTLAQMAADAASSGIIRMLFGKGPQKGNGLLSAFGPGIGADALGFSTIPGLGNGIMPGETGGIPAFLMGALGFIPGIGPLGGLLGGLGGILGFDKGGMLPDVAMVHRGEMVVQPRPGSMALPKELTDAILSGGRSRGAAPNVSIVINGNVDSEDRARQIAAETARHLAHQINTAAPVARGGTAFA